MLCSGAINATAVALSAVGSLFGTDSTADSATAVALIAPLHNMYCSPLFRSPILIGYGSTRVVLIFNSGKCLVKDFVLT